MPAIRSEERGERHASQAQAALDRVALFDRTSPRRADGGAQGATYGAWGGSNGGPNRSPFPVGLNGGASWPLSTRRSGGKLKLHMREILRLEGMTGEQAVEWVRENQDNPEVRRFHRRLQEWRQAGLSPDEIVDTVLTAR